MGVPISPKLHSGEYAKWNLCRYKGKGPCPVKNRTSALFQFADCRKYVKCGSAQIPFVPFTLPLLHHIFSKDIFVMTFWQFYVEFESAAAFARLSSASFLHLGRESQSERLHCLSSI
ncbi:hypothetical protein AVEN_78870-1 [Araneus ventricosus]|uniref:Uncharacterized protein n=1 Tax=Araneus ventricosus TaxID=182803 RepID=A0A4Y2SKU0_ARAVE|nr:hypothetical protein AVEN_78870-1 [Araneus ventricosus]